MPNLEIIIAIVIAYLFGSISSAILVCQMMGLPDPRSQGSRNPGATNVLRIGGKKPAFLTLLGDMLKGFLPVWVAQWYGLSTVGMGLVALAAFLGHLFPIFFRFEGGKGVATLLGALLALSWSAGIGWIVSWFVVALLFRYASLASIVASALAPFYIWYFSQSIVFSSIISLMCLLLIYRHRSNILSLLAGNERKIGKKV